MTDPTSDREVSLTITRDPSLVRTVRLVAASIARRAGLDAAAVEEVRLAVGETCAVMVGPVADEHPVRSASEEQVTVTLRVDGGLVAEIEGPSAEADTSTADAPLADLGDLGDLADLVLDPWILVRGLREDVDVTENGASTRVRLSWTA